MTVWLERIVLFEIGPEDGAEALYLKPNQTKT